VYVLGHDDVANDAEAVGDPRLFQHAQREVTPPRETKEWTASITTEGDEVEMSFAVVTLEIPRHRGSLSQEHRSGILLLRSLGIRFHPHEQKRLVWGTPASDLRLTWATRHKYIPPVASPKTTHRVPVCAAIALGLGRLPYHRCPILAVVAQLTGSKRPLASQLQR
jgi:hypothetical protein